MMQSESRLKDIYMLFSTPDNTINSTPSKDFPQTPEYLQISSHLESLTRAHIHAVNTKNYDITSPAWSNLSPNFISDVRSVCMKNPRRLNRDEYVEQYRGLAQLRPDYHLEVKIISTELKLLPRGVSRGEVTMSLENTGNPPGVARMIVVMVEWRRDGEGAAWECVETKAARGVDEFESRNDW